MIVAAERFSLSYGQNMEKNNCRYQAKSFSLGYGHIWKRTIAAAKRFFAALFIRTNEI
ncbi:MAG: hypothetical protein GX924_02115 [Clostridiaceae bacterium]|nr:hypothetical protein [Clostridiaceae bacterium]